MPRTMDKETLIRLAQPAATALLALSIFSVPIVSKADWGGRGTKSSPIHIVCQAPGELGLYFPSKCN